MTRRRVFGTPFLGLMRKRLSHAWWLHAWLISCLLFLPTGHLVQASLEDEGFVLTGTESAVEVHIDVPAGVENMPPYTSREVRVQTRYHTWQTWFNADTSETRTVDVENYPLAGTPIVFSVLGDGAVSDATANTDSSGYATTDFTLGSQASTVTATVAGSSAAASVSFAQPTPETWTWLRNERLLSAVPVSSDSTNDVPLGGLRQVQVQTYYETWEVYQSNYGRLKEEYRTGSPAIGAQIAWSVASGDGVVTPLTTQTDGLGCAWAAFEMGALGSVLRANVTYATSNVTSATLDFFPAPETWTYLGPETVPSSLALSTNGRQDQLPAGTQRTVTATATATTRQVWQNVNDPEDIRRIHAVESPAAGLPITFTLDGPGSLSEATATTETNGQTAVTFTMSDAAARVCASAAGGSGAATLDFSPFQETWREEYVTELWLSNLYPDAAPDETLEGDIRMVTAAVVEKYWRREVSNLNNTRWTLLSESPAGGVAVAFAVDLGDGQTETVSTATNEAGLATVQVTMGAEAVTVEASLDAFTRQSLTLDSPRWKFHRVADSVSVVVSANSRTDLVQSGEVRSLTAEVLYSTWKVWRDSEIEGDEKHGDKTVAAANGAVVTFTILPRSDGTAGTGTLANAESVTDANGQATATFIMGTEDAKVQVEARYATVESSIGTLDFTFDPWTFDRTVKVVRVSLNANTSSSVAATVLYETWEEHWKDNPETQERQTQERNRTSSPAGGARVSFWPDHEGITVSPRIIFTSTLGASLPDVPGQATASYSCAPGVSGEFRALAWFNGIGSEWSNSIYVSRPAGPGGPGGPGNPGGDLDPNLDEDGDGIPNGVDPHPRRADVAQRSYPAIDLSQAPGGDSTVMGSLIAIADSGQVAWLTGDHVVKKWSPTDGQVSSTPLTALKPNGDYNQSASDSSVESFMQSYELGFTGSPTGSDGMVSRWASISPSFVAINGNGEVVGNIRRSASWSASYIAVRIPLEWDDWGRQIYDGWSEGESVSAESWGYVARDGNVSLLKNSTDLFGITESGKVVGHQTVQVGNSRKKVPLIGTAQPNLANWGDFRRNRADLLSGWKRTSPENAPTPTFQPVYYDHREDSEYLLPVGPASGSAITMNASREAGSTAIGEASATWAQLYSAGEWKPLRSLMPEPFRAVMQKESIVHLDDRGDIVFTAESKEGADGNWMWGSFVLKGRNADASQNSVHRIVAGGEQNVTVLGRNIHGAMVAVINSRPTLIPSVELIVDGNRDGEMSFEDAATHAHDYTTAQTPYRFWLNNDDDHGTAPGSAGTEHVPIERPDHTSTIIGSQRDLEDWARLWISFKGITQLVKATDITLELQFEAIPGSPAPTIRVAKAVEADGGTKYIKGDGPGSSTTASSQAGAPHNAIYGPISGSASVNLKASPHADWISNLTEENPYLHLLFEGKVEGKGKLQLRIKKGGTLIGTYPDLFLDIRDVKRFYKRGKAQPENIAAPNGNVVSPPSVSPSYVPDEISQQLAFEADPNEEKKAVIFVHGWSMDYNNYTNFTETMFKRLWHQGFKGRFCSLRWDPFIVTNLLGIPQLPVTNGEYNRSEFQALLYGESLKQFANAIKDEGFTVTLIGHSMGNVVCSSALQKELSVQNYLLMEAAVPAGCYDTSGGNGANGVNGCARFWLVEADEPTPDFHQGPSGELTKGYRGFLSGIDSNVAGDVVNFHNSLDAALATGKIFFGAREGNWETNQEDYKPDGNLGPWHYEYYPTRPNLDDRATHEYELFVGSSVRFVTDSYEMKSFVARSRSKAVGAVEGTDDNPLAGGSINDSVNLRRDHGFGREDYDHSGQFNRRIQQLHPLYQRIFEFVK